VIIGSTESICIEPHTNRKGDLQSGVLSVCYLFQVNVIDCAHVSFLATGRVLDSVVHESTKDSEV